MAADSRPHNRRPDLPGARRPTITATRLTPDELVITAPFGDQTLKVEHGPSFAGFAVRGELVIVLVQGA